MTAISWGGRTRPSDSVYFREFLGSEWTKIRTVHSTFWTLLATLVVVIGLSGLFAFAISRTFGSMSAQEKADFDLASAGTIGVNFGMITLGALGVLVISSEYSTGMIRTSLTAVPRRSALLAAKLTVLGVVALIAGEFVSFASVILSHGIFVAHDINVSLGDDGVLRAVVGGGLYLALVTIFALGIGTILRHTAGAITTVLGVLFVLPIFGSFLPGDWGDSVAKFMPSNAGGAILNAHPASDAFAPWTGLAVFAGYTAIVLAVAFVLFERRDA